MEMIKKILVPIDFSDYSKNALKYAANFAKFFGEIGRASCRERV